MGLYKETGCDSDKSKIQARASWDFSYRRTRSDRAGVKVST